MDQRKVSNGWAAWFLILAAAAPATVILRVGWKVMTGSADEPFGLQDRALTGLELLGNRWSSPWMIQSISTLPLIGLLPLVVLAALVVAERPRALVPTHIGRLAATLVAASTAALGLIGTIGLSAQLSGLLPGLGWGSITGSQVEAYGPVAALVLTTTVLGVATTAVLWPRKSTERNDEAAIVPVVGETVGEEATEDGASADRPAEPDRPKVIAGPRVIAAPDALPPAVGPSALPLPSATDLDLYRRQ